METSEILKDLGALTAAIFIIVGALRGIPGIKAIMRKISGEALALIVAVIAVGIFVWTGQMEFDLTAIILMIAALIGAQQVHDKVAKPVLRI